jgi:hypothetical protein
VAGECLPDPGCITSDDCIDGIACTEDICEQNTCLNIPDDGLCDDGTYCNGEELCDPVNDCISTGDPCSTGTVCNEESNTCDPFVSPYSYSKDFLEQGNPGGWIGSLKTFDDEWALSPSGTVDMDIWLNDLPEPMLTAGCYITFDPDLITITNLVPNDTHNGGQWDGGATSLLEIEPGIWFLALADFGCVEPDVDGDILLARATFQRQAVGVVEVTIQTIPEFDTLVDCSGVNYDPLIPSNTIIINDGITASGCFGNFDNDSDVDGTDAGIFKLDFGRSTLSNPCEGDMPCNGDFDCDTDVDGNDAYEFKTEFGRCQFANPCPISAATVNCTY